MHETARIDIKDSNKQDIKAKQLTGVFWKIINEMRIENLLFKEVAFVEEKDH